MSTDENKSESEYRRRASQYIGTLQAIGERCTPETVILDFGCGAGNLVEAFNQAGLRSYGCDLSFKEGPHVDRLSSARHIRLIDPSDYRLPFDDNMFDLVVSDQVFEHVQDYDSAISEIVRVLKPGGATFHIFPPRYKPVEPHVRVPFATWLQNYPWLTLWALFGIRKDDQKGMNSLEVAKRNLRYLKTSTNYLTKSQIRSSFNRHFEKVSFCEDALSRQLADGKYRTLNKLPFGIFSRLVGTFHTRAVYASHPKQIASFE